MFRRRAPINPQASALSRHAAAIRASDRNATETDQEDRVARARVEMLECPYELRKRTVRYTNRLADLERLKCAESVNVAACR